MQEYIWSSCFRQHEGATQELIDCKSPLADAEARRLLETYRASPTLLPHLREWMSTMKVSAIVVHNMQGDGQRLLDGLGAQAGSAPAP